MVNFWQAKPAFLILLHLINVQATTNITISDQLIDDIFSNYHTAVRPRCGVNNTVHVVLDLALRQIIELDEPKQILHTNCWLRITWNDCRLVWNSSRYNGIDNIVVPSTTIWYPDLTLYDSSAKSTTESIKEYRIGVSADGSIRQYLPAVLVSLCTIDVSVFPFDEQVCNLTFGMWMHSGLDVDITPKGNADLSKYINHTEWQLISLNSLRIMDMFDSSAPFPVVVYQLVLKRKPLFYLINLVFPCILISNVALLGFILPPDSGEKVNLEITVLLSLAVFQLIVLDTMPPSSESPPVIGLYFASTMVMVALSCLMTVFVLNIHLRGRTDTRAPYFLRFIIIRTLGKVFCLQTIDKEEPQESVEMTFASGHAAIFQEVDYPTRKPKNNNITSVKTPVNGGVKTMDSIDIFSELIRIHQKILTTLEHIGNRLCENANVKRNSNEWHLMAIILDRFFLLMFLIISVSLAISFMIR